ncbi:MAG: hypothetical protein J6X69_07385 [Bacteroidales bacterium]|nr:hypothetical protein [Bacteroidales bacterium]
MKRFLLILLLIGTVQSLYAQLSPQMEAYLRENPRRAAGVIHSYEFLPIKDTPAPSGFKPFYISLYGRHGSRSHSSDQPYVLLQDCLQAAKEEGILTSSGDSLLACATQMIQLHDGMDGRLTSRGAREHERIARRMVQRFPAVFKKGEVHAISSDVPRCLVSMAAFTSSLRACKSDLVITWDCGVKYQRIITLNSPKSIKKQAKDDAHSALTNIPVDTAAVYGRFFTNPDKGRQLTGKSKHFISAIFNLARFAEAYDIEENRYRFLPWEVVATTYARHTLQSYLSYCNSVPYGDEALKEVAPLASEMCKKADEAIAGAPVAADLIFGHDLPFMCLCSYFGLEGFGYPRLTAEEAYGNWTGAKLCTFASNLQMVFYKNRKGEILVKFLANEQETLIPELTSYSGPYYRWENVKNRMEIKQQ